MGQAKKRGSREDRIAQSIERQEREEDKALERKRLEQLRIESLPPEERKKINKPPNALFLAAMMGALSGRRMR